MRSYLANRYINSNRVAIPAGGCGWSDEERALPTAFQPSTRIPMSAGGATIRKLSADLLHDRVFLAFLALWLAASASASRNH